MSTTTLTYDQRGNLVQRLIEADWDADGTVDGATTYTRTYKWRDNLLLEVRTDDAGLDGTPDFTLTTRYTVDGRGNAIVTVVEIDWDGDGIVDEASTQTSTFNKRGQITSSIAESRDGEGLLYGTTKTTYSYDAHGNVIQIVREHDLDGDETPPEVDTTTYTYTHVTGR
jgi:YD repeat-containing protein